jgi:hypothetical protein
MAQSMSCQDDSAEGRSEAVEDNRVPEVLTRLLRRGRCGRTLHVRYDGQRGTAARSLCLGDFPAGGRYCLGIGGRAVDRRITEDVLGVLSPLGMRATLQAVEELGRKDSARREALGRQLDETEYGARRAFEQYHAVDARHRLVAGALERRWNAALEEGDRLRATRSELDTAAPVVSAEPRAAVLALGGDFAAVWARAACPPELKKKLLRTVLEEIIVTHDETADTLAFVLHWAGERTPR